MVECITADVRNKVGRELDEARAALAALSKYFKSTTLSAAIGDVSEELIAKYMRAGRKKRQAPYDLEMPDGTGIEVKSRFEAPDRNRSPGSLQFNFRQGTKSAQIAFCLHWVADKGTPPLLQQIFRVSVDELVKLWGQPETSTYCARTTLKELRDATQKSKGLPSAKQR